MSGYSEEDVAEFSSGLGSQDLEVRRDPELEKHLKALKSGIDILREILDNRIYPSLLFEMIEELTLAHVSFSSMVADLKQAKLQLQVEALNYSTFAKQVYVLQQDPRIKKVNFSGVDLGDFGRVTSLLNLELDPALLSNE